jgi:hypothetical protein
VCANAVTYVNSIVQGKELNVMRFEEGSGISIGGINKLINTGSLGLLTSINNVYFLSLRFVRFGLST